MLEIWKNLKLQLEEIPNRYLPHEVCTEKELLDFETKTRVIPPPDYKECYSDRRIIHENISESVPLRLTSTRGLSSFFINRRDAESAEKREERVFINHLVLLYLVFGFVAFGEYLQIHCPNFELSQFWIKSLKWRVNSALGRRKINMRDSDIRNVGISDTLLVLFWDLRTYGETDRNYDIYLARAEYFDGVYLVARDFTKFVFDFCLGTKSYEILPEYMHPS